MARPASNRRDFLKKSAGVSAVAALGSMAISRSAHAAGSDIIKIGMVGAGGRCSGAAHDAMTADPGTRLVAISDLFADRVQAKRQTLKKDKPNQVMVDDAHCFVGMDGYKHVIELVDVVLIACAAKFHPMYLLAGITAGKHVFVEKPHAIDPPGVRQVTEAAELAKKKNLGVFSGLQSRYHPAIRATIQRVLDGQIGEIVAIEENFLRGPYGTLYRAPGLSEIQYQYSNQYRFGWLCGDDVPQSLVHNVDRATWAMREQTPLKAHGLAGRSSCFDRPFVYGDVFDHHSVVYHYANGVRMYALTRTQPNCYNEVSSIIMGSKGTAYPLAGRIDGKNKWRYEPAEGENQNPYVAEHEAYFKSIRAGKPINCGDYMARSTMVGVLGQLTCYSGKEVSWDEAMTSNFYLGPKPEECTFDMDPPVKPDANGIYPVPIPGLTKNV